LEPNRKFDYFLTCHYVEQVQILSEETRGIGTSARTVKSGSTHPKLMKNCYIMLCGVKQPYLPVGTKWKAAWDFIDSIHTASNKKKPEFPNYLPGTWGPKDADILIGKDEKNGRFITEKSMKIYDISMAINQNIFVYKNKPEKKPKFEIVKNGNVYETTLTFNLHTGTHIDAPLHMIKKGDSVGSYDLHRFFTTAQVLDLSDQTEKITAEALKKKDIKANRFLILKTKNSEKEYFDHNFIYLDKSGALYLSKLAITGVGIDALGIERNQPNHDTHKILLEKRIVILEGLRLNDISEGEYLLSAFPLKINDSEAAPVRAVLIELPKAE